jgi:hypothetical protein
MSQLEWAKILEDVLVLVMELLSLLMTEDLISQASAIVTGAIAGILASKLIAGNFPTLGSRTQVQWHFRQI